MENSYFVRAKRYYTVKILLRLPVDTRRGRDEEERSRPTITRLDGVCRRNDDPLRLVLRP